MRSCFPHYAHQEQNVKQGEKRLRKYTLVPAEWHVGFRDAMGSLGISEDPLLVSECEDEGQTYEGSAVAGPDRAFEAAAKPSGPNVTATATDVQGNTSPFSQPLPVPP